MAEVLRNVNLKRHLANRKLLATITIASLFAASVAYVNAQNVTSSSESYIPVASWGKLGDGPGQFNKPKGLAVDNKGFVYVVDTGNARVQKFTDIGKFVAQIGSVGDDPGEFRIPYGIALDSKGNIYVTDQLRNNVQVFSNEGNYTRSWGSMGPHQGQFTNPLGIAIDNDDYVYVVDNGNKRVEKFTFDGNFTAQWGSYGPSNGQFIDPYSITVDPHGMVYVVDNGNKHIQKFTSKGEFMESWGGDSKIKISVDPTTIISDQTGNLYVADGSTNLIRKFNLEGALLNEVTDNRENFPISGIAIDSLGYVYVADYANDRIQKFGTVSSTWSGLQGTMSVINRQLATVIQGSSSETILLPASVHGALAKSGEATDVFGDPVILGETTPSIATGDSAKISGIVVQNKDSAGPHKIRVQLGYADKKGEFTVRQDIKVVLQAKGSLGDSVTLPLPEPFFVPLNQEKAGGTNVIVKVAADAPSVLVEVSVSGILNP